MSIAQMPVPQPKSRILGCSGAGNVKRPAKVGPSSCLATKKNLCMMSNLSHSTCNNDVNREPDHRIGHAYIIAGKQVLALLVCAVVSTPSESVPIVPPVGFVGVGLGDGRHG